MHIYLVGGGGDMEGYPVSSHSVCIPGHFFSVRDSPFFLFFFFNFLYFTHFFLLKEYKNTRLICFYQDTIISENSQDSVNHYKLPSRVVTEA